MVHGTWYMVYGIWYVVCGMWYVAYGIYSIWYVGGPWGPWALVGIGCGGPGARGGPGAGVWGPSNFQILFHFFRKPGYYGRSRPYFC